MNTRYRRLHALVTAAALVATPLLAFSVGHFYGIPELIKRSDVVAVITVFRMEEPSVNIYRKSHVRVEKVLKGNVPEGETNILLGDFPLVLDRQDTDVPFESIRPGITYIAFLREDSTKTPSLRNLNTSGSCLSISTDNRRADLTYGEKEVYDAISLLLTNYMEMKAQELARLKTDLHELLNEKDIPQLINDLAVQSEGQYDICSVAHGFLVMKKDAAVPALQEALRNENERIREGAMRCLGEINTKAARAALIDAFSNGTDDAMRKRALYELAQHPNQEAEQVYIDFLNYREKWYTPAAIQALGEIRSQKAVPYLVAIRDKPSGWACYYAALVALRKIESNPLAPEVQASLDNLRQAQYSQDVDPKKLAASVAIIQSNLQVVLPDVFDIYLMRSTALPSIAGPNAKTILRDAGKLAHAYVAIGRDNFEDLWVWNKTKTLIEELGWQAEYKPYDQPHNGSNEVNPRISP